MMIMDGDGRYNTAKWLLAVLLVGITYVRHRLDQAVGVFTLVLVHGYEYIPREVEWSFARLYPFVP